MHILHTRKKPGGNAFTALRVQSWFEKLEYLTLEKSDYAVLVSLARIIRVIDERTMVTKVLMLALASVASTNRG